MKLAVSNLIRTESLKFNEFAYLASLTLILMKTILFCILFILPFFCLAQQDKLTLVIHGGAGTIKKENMTPEQEKAYHDQMQEALRKGMAMLQKGAKSMDVVVEVIKMMEDSPIFNAGKGAVLTNEGKAELDASLMDGSNLKAGAVAGVTTIKNPIVAARKVMDNTPHVLLIGKGAEKFAKEQGLEIVDNEYFKTDTRSKQLDKLKEKEKKSKESGWVFDPSDKYGTVGCVALDQYGNLAAGTSTGGMANKKFGRVGDAPIIGAGTYANNITCAISCTGHGEFFIRSVVAYDIAALIQYKSMPVKEAAEMVVMDKLVKMGGEGGLIALDKNGNFAMPFNSSGMYRGYVKSDGKPYTFIFKEE